MLAINRPTLSKSIKLVRHTNQFYYSLDGKYKEKVDETLHEVNNRKNPRLFGSPISSKPKFNSILPPPNVTGDLHLGHALMSTIQDVICRWKLLNGENVQWIPGTDHAGIATQVIVEKVLLSERKLSRHDIGKEQFLKEIEKWKSQKGNRIKEDIIRLGTIFDWEREYFTLDEKQSNAVAEAFIQLFESDMIYRKKSIINWSCSLQSAVSDIEVDSLEINEPTNLTVPGYEEPISFGFMYEIAYKCVDSDDKVIVATTRPETILGDVAVAVHPNDSRYSYLPKNTRLWHPFRSESIPLVFDEFVEPQVGTGAVKITPSHNRDDFDVAQRHNLPLIDVFDHRGCIVERFERYAGLRRFDLRKRLISDLQELGLLMKKYPSKMSLPVCSRSNDVIEYIIKPQWFLRCKKLNDSAIRAVDEGKLQIDPPKFESQWKNWLQQHVDWCLSRQIWWGHRIPAYECRHGDRTTWIAAHSEIEALEKAKRKLKTDEQISIRQDDDVLDTWFSSGLLPFSVLGWPTKHESSIKSDFPLDILVTGHDILFFWVTKMVMLSKQLTNEIPFKKVLLHGLICDENGRKMSKSRGNVITPKQIIDGVSFKDIKNELQKSMRDGILSKKEYNLVLVEKENTLGHGIPACGVDALRFTLSCYDLRDHFIHFDVNQCLGNKKFFNKIWNAAKFTLDNCGKWSIESKQRGNLNSDECNDFDRWILNRLAQTLKTVKTAMENNEFSYAACSWRIFFYDCFCDVYIESTKIDFWHESATASRNRCEILKTCLAVGLKQMGVFTPFLSNELLKHLPLETEVDIERWEDLSIDQNIETIMEIISSVRCLKTANKISKKHGPKTHLFVTDKPLLELLQRNIEIFNLMSFASETIVHDLSIENFDEKKCFFATSEAKSNYAFGITVDILPEVDRDKIIDVSKQKKIKELIKQLEAKQKKLSKHERSNKHEKVARINCEIETLQQEIEALSKEIH